LQDVKRGEKIAAADGVIIGESSIGEARITGIYLY
jgi:cation transport ATPase